MSDYRNYIRYSAEDGFDGTTEETATYAQVKNVWTTTLTSEVGLFSPTDLGRINTPSIARIMLEGTIDSDADHIDVLDSTGAVRFTAPASIVSSGFFFLYPQDSIAIFSSGATKADILIEDLNEERLGTWILTESTANITPPQPYSERTLTEAATLAPWQGRLVVFLEFAADGDVALPVGVALGDTVTFIRSSDNGVPRIVTGASPGQVNGVATAGLANLGVNAYSLRSKYESVTYMRVTGGWQHDAGVGTPKLVVTTTNPATLPQLREGFAYIFSESTAAGAVLQLPAVAPASPLAGTALGSGYVVFNRDTHDHVLLPAVGETINGGASFSIPAKAVVRIEATGSANSHWLASSRLITQNSASIAALPATVPITGGTQIIRVTAVGAGDLTLPNQGNTPLDTELIITLASGAGPVRIIADNAGDSINGVIGIIPGQYFLQTLGDAVSYRRTTFGWTRTVLQAQPPPPIVSAGSVALLPFSGEQYVKITGAGATCTLPDWTKIAIGTKVFFQNASGGAQTLAAFAGQSILGLASSPISSAAGFIVYWDGDTSLGWKGWAIP